MFARPSSVNWIITWANSMRINKQKVAHNSLSSVNEKLANC